MKIETDPNKNRKNVEKHALPLEMAADLDWTSSVAWVDDRKDYGEVRIIALGYIGERLHNVCFVRTPTGIRPISLRKANNREIKYYAQQAAH